MKVIVSSIFWDFNRGETKRPQYGAILRNKGLKARYMLVLDNVEATDLKNGTYDVNDVISSTTGYCIFGSTIDILE